MRSLGTGDVLLAAGDMPAAIWVVQVAWCEACVSSRPGRNGARWSAMKAAAWLGWLDWLHQRPIEHLRAAEPTELFELDLEQFQTLWSCSAALRQWCAQQTPNAELVQLLLHLAHGQSSRESPAGSLASLIDSAVGRSTAHRIRNPAANGTGRMGAAGRSHRQRCPATALALAARSRTARP